MNVAGKVADEASQQQALTQDTDTAAAKAECSQQEFCTEKIQLRQKKGTGSWSTALDECPLHKNNSKTQETTNEMPVAVAVCSSDEPGPPLAPVYQLDEVHPAMIQSPTVPAEMHSTPISPTTTMDQPLAMHPPPAPTAPIPRAPLEEPSISAPSQNPPSEPPPPAQNLDPGVFDNESTADEVGAQEQDLPEVALPDERCPGIDQAPADLLPVAAADSNPTPSLDPPGIVPERSVCSKPTHEAPVLSPVQHNPEPPHRHQSMNDLSNTIATGQDDKEVQSPRRHQSPESLVADKIDRLCAASDDKSAAAALVKLVELARKGDKYEAAVVEGGGIECIIDAMRKYSSNVVVQQNGCAALRGLATSADNQVLIAALGGIPCILEAMRSYPNNAVIQENGCAALKNLASEKKNQVTIVDVGGLQCILKAMRQHPKYAAVQEKGCSALKNLAANADNQARIASRNGIQCILEAMRHHANATTIQENACSALKNLACDKKNQVTIVAVGGIRCILEAMRQHPNIANVQEKGCSVLKNLASCNKNRVVIAAAEGIQRIIDAMRRFPKNCSIQEKGCSALKNLAYNQDNKAKIVDLGGIHCTLDAMRQHPDHAGIHEQACWVFYNLSFNANNRMILKVSEAEGAVREARDKFLGNSKVRRAAWKAMEQLVQ